MSRQWMIACEQIRLDRVGAARSLRRFRNQTMAATAITPATAATAGNHTSI